MCLSDEEFSNTSKQQITVSPTTQHTLTFSSYKASAGNYTLKKKSSGGCKSTVCVHTGLLGGKEETIHCGLFVNVNNIVATHEERQVSERKMEVNICRMNVPRLDRRMCEDGD